MSKPKPPPPKPAKPRAQRQGEALKRNLARRKTARGKQSQDKTES